MDNVQLTDAERAVVISVSNRSTAAKAKWADARNAFDEAQQAVEAADRHAQTAIATIVAIRQLDGNWTPSADARELVRV